MLINSHPIFGESAFALGAVNEPPPGGSDPSLEMRLLRVRLAAREHQTAEALASFNDFANEFTEVRDKHIFLVTMRRSYSVDEEFSVSYGPAYHRTYDAYRYEAPRPAVCLPEDTFGEKDMACRSWPHRVPAWWNIYMQPLHRPAFKVSLHGDVHIVPDLPPLVLTRRLLPLQADRFMPKRPKRSRQLMSSRTPTDSSSLLERLRWIHSKHNDETLTMKKLSEHASDQMHDETQSAAKLGWRVASAKTASVVTAAITPSLSPQCCGLPLEKEHLHGRKVLVPKAQFPDDPCDEHGSLGWEATIVKVHYRFIVAVRFRNGNYPIEYFKVADVLKWKPLL
mmetsp:Transcript_36667/g.60725  ORF Transcript_36667/g.60725 Transcript_36667/m.60725 type:complete len:338 (+) Transcript_36667:127-1140(+)